MLAAQPFRPLAEVSNQVSNNDSGHQGTQEDAHGWRRAGQPVYGRWHVTSRVGFGTKRPAVRLAPLVIARSPPVRCAAELSRTGSWRRLRRRWPGVSGGLWLGSPARRTPGHAARLARSAQLIRQADRTALQVKLPGQRTRESALDTSTPANRAAAVSPTGERAAHQNRTVLDGASGVSEAGRRRLGIVPGRRPGCPGRCHGRRRSPGRSQTTQQRPRQ